MPLMRPPGSGSAECPVMNMRVGAGGNASGAGRIWTSDAAAAGAATICAGCGSDEGQDGPPSGCSIVQGSGASPVALWGGEGSHSPHDPGIGEEKLANTQCWEAARNIPSVEPCDGGW